MATEISVLLAQQSMRNGAGYASIFAVRFFNAGPVELEVILGDNDSRIVVIGGSAGSIGTLEEIVNNVNASIEAPILVVVHIPEHARSMLPMILSRHGELPAHHVDDEEPLNNGHIYVAPPARHMVVSQGKVGLIGGARINRHRPSIDALFLSAARAYGSRVIAVLLSGYLDDGVAGLRAVKEAGGTTVVQDPGTTMHPDMPLSALARVEIDYTLPPSEIGAMLMRLAAAPEAEMNDPSQQDHGPINTEVRVETLTRSTDAPEPEPTPELIAMSCPDCGGVLIGINPPFPDRFRCRVGHAFSLESLFAAKSEEIETALWTAVRAIEEKSVMSKSLAMRLNARGATSVGARYDTMADAMQRDANIVRTMLESMPAAPPAES